MHVELDEGLPIMLKLDSVRISQILINLLGNAVKFTSNGNIWLRLKVKSIDGQFVKLGVEIEDDGPGIPEDKQEAIFENFSQIEREKTEYQGTGLGLSIVKKLVSLYGSDIFLESKQGKGSKFFFDLNLEIDHEAEAVEVKQLAEDVPVKNRHILVVEDNKINQIVTQNILEKENFACTIVSNGEAAIKVVEEQEFDLILMDLNMPIMNGYQASKEIRKFNTHTPIVALTASELDEIKVKVLESGINDIIIKPYDNYEFYQTIFRNINASRN